MTTPTWPQDLPAAPLVAGYQETPADTVLRSAMDQGQAKLRRRTTAGVSTLQTAFLLSAAQAQSLLSFYKDTLEGGAKAFDLTHPRAGGTVTCRFTAPPEVSGANGSYFRVAVALEILP